MGRPRSISDEDLLAAARTLFRERGHAVSTREIAEAAGVTQAVLYQRFPNKHDLFFSAMVPDAPDVDAILGPPTTPVATYLEGVAMRMLAYFEATHPTVMQLMAHPEFDAKVMGKLHERVLSKQLVDALAGRLKTLQAEGAVGAIDPVASAQAIIAALHSFVMFHVMSGASLGRHARHLVPKMIDVFWTGLAPR